MKLHYQQRSYPFRSPGLQKFLQLLRDAYPDWVDMATLERYFSPIHPRQLARFVDTLEAANLPLVQRETKTRGPFRLAVDPGQFSMHDDVGQAHKGTVAPKPLADTTTTLSVYENEHWVDWVTALFHANLALHEGEFLGEHGALDYLEQAETACATLPAWTLSVVYVRLAFVLSKIGRAREATHWLRRVESAIRHGHAHPAAQARMQYVWAKMRYDQQRYDEAERLLAAAVVPDDPHCPHLLNMSSLIAGRKFMTADALSAPYFLAQALERIAEAFGAVFLWHGDTNLLNGLSYNFANNLLRAIRCKISPLENLSTAMLWMQANRLICRKQGIGEDSILINLLIIETLLEHQGANLKLPTRISRELEIFGGPAGLLEESLTHVRKINNALEVALCLELKLHLPISSTQAELAYLEAADILRKLGDRKRQDTLAQTWQQQFGKPPPKAGADQTKN